MRSIFLLLLFASVALTQSPNPSALESTPILVRQTYPTTANWLPPFYDPSKPELYGPSIQEQFQAQEKNWQQQLAAMLNKWQLDEKDRLIVYRSLRGNSEKTHSLALSVLNSHTHADNIEELIRFIIRDSVIDEFARKRAEAILQDHLFYTEARQRAAFAREAVANNVPPRNLHPFMEGIPITNNYASSASPGKNEPVPVLPSELEMSRAILANPKEPKESREKALAVLVKSRKLLDLIAMQKELPTASDDMKKRIALSLAGTKEGADLLFASARMKQVPAAVVTDAAVVEKLKATGVRNLDERINSLK